MTAREQEVEELGAAPIPARRGCRCVADEPCAELTEAIERGAGRLAQSVGLSGDRAVGVFDIEPARDRVAEQAFGAIALADRLQTPFVRDATGHRPTGAGQKLGYR